MPTPKLRAALEELQSSIREVGGRAKFRVIQRPESMSETERVDFERRLRAAEAFTEQVIVVRRFGT